jgi:hypothetical protein
MIPAMRIRLLPSALTLVIVALIALIAMLAIKRGVEVSAPPPVELSTGDRAEAERIIRARINSLSTVPPKLGGRFDVTSLEWDARGRATVTYGDGESTFRGVATVETGSGRVHVSGFEQKE